MNSSGFVSTNLNCGFFDIYPSVGFEIVNPGINLSRVLGMSPADSAEGLNYIDLVCPEDREQVSEAMLEVYNDGLNCEEMRRQGRCIRHRLLMPDERVVIVSLIFCFYPKGYLACSAASTHTVKESTHDITHKTYTVSLKNLDFIISSTLLVELRQTAFCHVTLENDMHHCKDKKFYSGNA